MRRDQQSVVVAVLADQHPDTRTARRGHGAAPVCGRGSFTRSQYVASVRTTETNVRERHRFAHVAVRPQPIALEHVTLLPRGRQDHHRHRARARIRAQPAEHLQTADLRQVDVQQHQRRLHRGPVRRQQRRQARLPVRHRDDRVVEPVLAERAPRQQHVVRIVLGQQDRGVVHRGPPSRDAGGRSGSTNRNTAPRSGCPSAQIRPPCRLMMRPTIARPIPLPGEVLVRVQPLERHEQLLGVPHVEPGTGVPHEERARRRPAAARPRCGSAPCPASR